MSLTQVRPQNKKQALLERISELEGFKLLVKALESEPDDAIGLVDATFEYTPLPEKREIYFDKGVHGWVVPIDEGNYPSEREIQARKKVEEECKATELQRMGGETWRE